MEDPEKRGVGRMVLGVAVLAMLATAVLTWRSCVGSPPVPTWSEVVAEALRLEGRPVARIVLVGATWPDARTIDGVEPMSVATIDEAPQAQLAGDPTVLVLVRKAAWEADRERSEFWTKEHPLDCTGGQWLLVRPPPGVP